MKRRRPSKELESNQCPDPTWNPRNPYKGVYLRTRGKWTSEIWDPVTHSRLYLGTFSSAEAAHGAYCAKKLELDETAAPRKQKIASGEYSKEKDGFRVRKSTKSGTVSGPSRYPTRVRVGKTHRTALGYVLASDSDNSDSEWRGEEGKKITLDNEFDFINTGRLLRRPRNRRISYAEEADELISRSPKAQRIKLGAPYKGVVQYPSGKFEAKIRDPVSRTSFYLGMFGSAEAARAAWCAKKLEIDEKNSKNVNNYKRVVKTKSGNKWTARIRHPTKGLISLGNFWSKEAAFRAHYRKKLEIEENESQKIGVGHIESPPKAKIISEGVFEEEKSGKTFPEKPKKQKFISKSPYKGVREMNPGKWVSRIWNPVTKKGMWIGTFGSAEAAYEAYCAKQLEIKEKAASEGNEREVGKTRDCLRTRYWDKLEIEGKAHLEEEKKLQEGACGPDAVSHIVDRNGFLLGEFSQIDDLAICDAD